MASKQKPTTNDAPAESGPVDVGTFRITRPLRSAAGDLYRPGMEAAYLASRPTDEEVARHRESNSIAGRLPKL